RQAHGARLPLRARDPRRAQLRPGHQALAALLRRARPVLRMRPSSFSPTRTSFLVTAPATTSGTRARAGPRRHTRVPEPRYGTGTGKGQQAELSRALQLAYYGQVVCALVSAGDYPPHPFR